MKRIDLQIEYCLHEIIFPKCRISSREELLIILLETLRYALIAEKIPENSREENRIVIFVDDMQRIFYFSEKKFYSITLPFKLQINNEDISFSYEGIDIDHKFISEAIAFFKSDYYISRSPYDFITPIDRILDEGDENFWEIIRYLLTFDIGYVRYDDDEIGFKKAEKKGYAQKHPRFHLDVNYSNQATYKLGLLNKLKYLDFIQILDNKTDRWKLDNK